MALKWKKDGTAKCGPFTAQVDNKTSRFDWYARVYTKFEQYGKESCHAVINPPGVRFFGWPSEKIAREKAETWLSKQVAKMQSDLKGVKP